MPQERLQKIMARAGVASRRASEELIRQGRVTINGTKVEIGAKADPATDTIRVDGEELKLAENKLIYIMLNKPKGVVSAASAQRQEKRGTVLDLVDVEERVYPVGRLDADSEGLLLLTNDGDLTQQLTHPRYGHSKVYRVLVRGYPSQEKLDRWAAGVTLDDGPTRPCTVEAAEKVDKATWLIITMKEGRKRQIRRTAAVLHMHVMQLQRVKFGPLELGSLEPGQWRELKPHEIDLLRRNTGFPAKKPKNKARRPYNKNWKKKQ